MDGTGPEKLMLFMPASNGKSELVSRRLPAYLLGQKACKVIACSHTATLAEEMSTDVREIISDVDYPFDVDIVKGGTDSWRTSKGGRYVCAGVGGAVTGKHFDFGIIDDPVKNPEEAFSAVMREKLWQWYTRVFRQRRIGGNARMLLTMTRWHADDLAGRILKREPGDWKVLKFPAIAKYDEPERLKGEALWPDRYSLEFLQKEKGLNPHGFASNFQQDPVREGGDMFHAEWNRYARCGRSPNVYVVAGKSRNIRNATKYLTVDLATSTQKRADFTVIGTWASWPDGELMLTNVIRKHLEGPDIIPEIVLELNRSGAGTVWIEAIGFQTSLIQAASRQGLPVRKLTPDKDKVTRAGPAAALMADGHVWTPADADWLLEYEEELADFPAGEHDDQVDVLAYGVRVHADRSGWKMRRQPI